jgi:hypothetical protein
MNDYDPTEGVNFGGIDRPAFQQDYDPMGDWLA